MRFGSKGSVGEFGVVPITARRPMGSTRRQQMEKASRTLVSPGKTKEDAKEAALAMYRALTGKEPSKKQIEELERKVAKTAKDLKD